MANPEIVHDLAKQVVINKEVRDLKQMISEAEIAQTIQDPNANDLIRATKIESQRLKPVNKFDHEETFIGTTIYTTGRVNGPRPKTENI